MVRARDAATPSYCREKPLVKTAKGIARHGSTSIFDEFPMNYMHKMNPKTARRMSCLSVKSMKRYGKPNKGRSKSLANQNNFAYMQPVYNVLEAISRQKRHQMQRRAESMLDSKSAKQT